MKQLSAIALLPVLVLGVPAVHAAEPSSVTRTTLQTQDFPGLIYKTTLIKAVIAPGGRVPPHMHPGVEIGYIASGKASLTIKGSAARSLGAGDSFAIPQHAVHSLQNMGPEPLTVLSTYVVDKSKPILIPVK